MWVWCSELYSFGSTVKSEKFISSVKLKNSIKLEDGLVEDAHVLLHPIRYRIVELLAENPMHINQISKAMGEERRPYHLLALEECGFVNSKYEISESPKSKGKAIRKYWVTDKVDNMIAEIKKKL
jgi:DNA-binding transcriptional ArsR family regulator